MVATFTPPASTFVRWDFGLSCGPPRVRNTRGCPTPTAPRVVRVLNQRGRSRMVTAYWAARPAAHVETVGRCAETSSKLDSACVEALEDVGPRLTRIPGTAPRSALPIVHAVLAARNRTTTGGGQSATRTECAACSAGNSSVGSRTRHERITEHPTYLRGHGMHRSRPVHGRLWKQCGRWTGDSRTTVGRRGRRSGEAGPSRWLGTHRSRSRRTDPAGVASRPPAELGNAELSLVDGRFAGEIHDARVEGRPASP